MARNGSGTMSILNSVSANRTIEASKINANFTDIASEITASLPTNGEAGMTGQFKASDGTSGAPGLSFVNDTDCGFYRISANRIGVAGTLKTSNGNISAFPAGTAMLFIQTTAPMGWTKDTTHNNKAIRIVTGTASSGGSTAFTSVFAARTIAQANLPAHDHTFSGTTSTDGAHTHTYTEAANEFGVTTGATTKPRGVKFTSSTGSNGSHSHTYSGTTSSVGSGTAWDFAVQYVDLIAATKDA
jgi:hypothetical protein